MRGRIYSTVLALALGAAFAAPAAAVFHCMDCDRDMPPGTRCFASCDGQIIRYCTDWFAFGCDSLRVLPAQSRMATDSDEAAEERFLRSLRAETAAPAGCE